MSDKFAAAIRPILEESERQAAEVRSKMDAGEIDWDTALWKTAAILKDTHTKALNKAADLLIDAAIVQPLAEHLKSFGPVGMGGVYSDTRAACKHGRTGQCAECNTEWIDALGAKPGTIKITIGPK